MLHFRKRSTSVAKNLTVGSIRQKSGSNMAGISTSSTAIPLSPGMGQSTQQTPLDLSPLLDGFLYHKEEKNLIDVYKDIYFNDSVAGTTVDFMSTLPFSEFSLSGFKDDAMRAPFTESVDRLNIRTLLPELSVDYLVTGNFIGSLIFDSDKKVFVDIIPQDFKNLTIQNLPFYGVDPIITVKYPRELINLFNSKHPRIRAVLESYGDEVVTKIRKGSEELDPVSTIYLPRKTMTSTEGTSFYRRILPIYFLEKNIFRGTLLESIKRQRAILHVTMGDQDWEPTAADLDYIGDLFTKADSDPLGAVIATRTGVQTQDVRNPTDFWSINQLWSETVPSKLRALGTSEAFLSSESNFNVVDAAISSFMESLEDYRSKLTRKIFYDKIFPLISLVNEFYEDDASREKIEEIAKNSQDGSISSIMYQIQDTTGLIIPTLEWEKKLKPAGDEAMLSQLDTLRNLGVPIPLRVMAAAGGFNLDNLLAGREEDVKLQKEASDWRAEIAKLASSDNSSEDQMFASSTSPEEWKNKFGTLLAAYKNFPKDVQDKLIASNPSNSDVINSGEAKPLKDRDFGIASEAFTVDKNGKPHYVINQKEAQTHVDNMIIRSIRSRS